MKHPSQLTWENFTAVLLDLDGVITPTAEVHEHAWSELFKPWGFTTNDYLTHIDGKPRYDGVNSYMNAVGIQLPAGHPDDPPGQESIYAMGNKKNQLFKAILERDGVSPYPGSLALLELLDRAQISQAVVSSSQNARPVLQAAGLGQRFEHIVDGVTAKEQQLAGKPDPAMFLYAANLLSVTAENSVVIEDAVAGVKAAVAGAFGFVLGVDRGGNRDALLSAGAHLVVEDLAETI